MTAPAGYLHPDVVQTLADVREALRSHRCSEGVSRMGGLEPCGNSTVAVRYDPDEGKPYAVCVRHARADMVSLLVILAALGVTP